MSLQFGMDMDIPAVTLEELFIRLRDSFYTVVPTHYQTYCALTAKIAQRTLADLGIEASLVPCQLWYAGPERNYVLGFCSGESAAKWDGHVICMAGGWLIDTTVAHVQRDIGVPVPKVVITDSFGVRSNVISRFDLREGERLWWHHPPLGADVSIPQEPEDVVVRFANELSSRIGAELATGRLQAGPGSAIHTLQG